ncbi:MAG: hypothetical protein ACSW8F_06160, partial [bacterium]
FSERGLPTQELMRLQIITRVTLNKRLAVVAEQGLLKKEKYRNTNYYSMQLSQLDALLTKQP